MRLPFWRRRRREEELEEEIQAHLEMAARDRIERGEEEAKAREFVRREFGNVGLIKEVTREMWGWTGLERFGQDLRYGARMLWKSPGFTLISILTLALGIGANTVIFSVVDVALLRPIQFHDPDRLVRLYQEIDDNWVSFSAPDFEDCKNQNRIFESLAAYGGRSANLTGSGEPEHVSFAAVSADFFKALEVEPALGRGFLPEEDKPGGPQVVVLSYRFRQRRFGADPQIVGVVGDVDQEDMMYRPLMQNPAGTLNLMARSSGDIANLWAAMEKRIRELDRDIPVNRINGMSLLVGESVAPRLLSILLLMMFAGLALVLAMDGVYGVMSYAVQQRTHEIGIRRAFWRNSFLNHWE